MSTSPSSLRIWPALVIAVFLILVRYVIPAVAPDVEIFGVDAAFLAIFGGLVGGLAILLWWLFFSRARWSERLIALAVMALAVVAIRPFTHISLQNGMMGMMFFIYAVPTTLGLALVAWAVLSQRMSGWPRRAAMIVAIVIGCGVWTLARSNGIYGGVADIEWRWTPTREELLLAQTRDEPPLPTPTAAPAAAPEAPVAPAAPASGAPPPGALGAPGAPAPGRTEPHPAAPGAPAPSRTEPHPAAPSAPAPSRTEPHPAAPSAPAPGRTEPHPAAPGAPGAWPGFRGASRDSVVRGVSIATDWSASPPVEMWRRPIGPGWSSFSVSGDLLYTQEQRGDEEMVTCYRVSTGEPVWRHRDAIRFWEPEGGAGPRGTPAVHRGRVYAMGATGTLNALDAATGALLWSRNAPADTSVAIPDWGVASSPLVVDDVVVVSVSGRLAGYDAATGNPKWLGPTGGAGYSSPHLVTIDGVPQILLLRGSRTVSVSPADGTLLWEHTWLPGVAIVQPAMAGRDVLITTGDAMGGLGVRRLAVTREASAWTVQERWSSRGLKPYFNDFVVHEGHAYGFDGSILSSISLEDGERKWKGGRYGNGQMILLAEQDLLLVLSEEGELALVSATPDKFTEVARFPALNAKTWNHPVMVGNVLLVRNGEEMAAFRMPAASAGR
jgi:outer membrane protein assembly factor BamB